MPELTIYLNRARRQASWRGYRRGKARYRQLIDDLTMLQHGLCGYCEINLRDDNRQVEHVVPQSHPRHGAHRALDPTNLIACCGGGETQSEIVRNDPERHGEASCGRAKSDKSDPDFIDPRALPELVSLMRVRGNGQIEADDRACSGCGIAAGKVTRTIEILNLNAKRLQRARRRHRRRLARNWQAFSTKFAMDQWIYLHLLPDRDGKLRRFFTTSRSLFGESGERILAQGSYNWI